MNIFEEITSALDMPTVAEFYGLQVNRSGMVLCPFHEEKTPSAKIYHDNFHCFGCGVHLDVIGFTSKFFELSPLDSAKKLNADFGLGIALNGSFRTHEISEYQKQKIEREKYREWEKSAWKTLNTYSQLLRVWKNMYAPKSPDESLDERFVYALHHIDYAEYLCDEFIRTEYKNRGIFKEQIEKVKHILNEIEKRLST